MTPADRLRTAARLMRERAEAATPGPWESLGGGDVVGDHSFTPYVARAYRGHEFAQGNEAHIASWHPAVALAVADWLDGQANDCEHQMAWDERHGFQSTAEKFALQAYAPALAVANAYLGTPDSHPSPGA